MTNKEAIAVLLKMIPQPRRGDSMSTTHTTMAAALLKGILALMQSDWIPVSERLPKPGEYDGDVDKYYLVQNEYGDMMVATYTHSEYWEQIFQVKPIADEIVAWMPLPEEYKPESEVEE